MTTDTAASNLQPHTILNSSFPVLLPENKALFISDADFHALIKRETAQSYEPRLSNTRQETEISKNVQKSKAPFIAGLERHQVHHRTLDGLVSENKTLTENSDMTNVSSKNVIVDLFYDLGEESRSVRLKTLLKNAWAEDALLTLKIIFNARSIHLGKSSKIAAYKALGWLAETHPLTLLANLTWLVRPVIPKKGPKSEKKEEHTDSMKGLEEEFEMVDAEETDPSQAHDVRNGLSHGYWKDLLNLVVFAANDQLKFDLNPASLLNQRVDGSLEGKLQRNWDPNVAKILRHQQKMEQNERVQKKINEDPFYRALHFTVARLFAQQLRADKALLDSVKKTDMKKLSLAAKWAPTFGEFHDKHTFIQSTIAEILFPEPSAVCPDGSNRELYLRHAREQYRKQYASPLRKALNVVERDIVAKNFGDIKYERVPSLAMNRYTGLFLKNDYEHFKQYIRDVALGNAKISGATLLPSTLISKARLAGYAPHEYRTKDFKAIKAAETLKIEGEVIDGQWNTLVQRVRDAGTLQSSLAICDVSGSMSHPQFSDGSCPMDSAIGLALIIAGVTSEPFGGGFISFHEKPTYISVGGDEDKRGLVDKVRYIEHTPWGYNTNFVSVFEDVILPMAIDNKLAQEDMVKQVFVFSDMQFDAAESTRSDRWTSSFERIKKKYEEAGYEMPRMIFWNLAAEHTDKPVTMDDSNTVLVSGYSQGMLRAFLETGALDEEEELIEEAVVGEDGMTEVKKVKKQIDPMTVVRKTVDHAAYSMLEIMD